MFFGDKMKKFLKVISLILAITIFFCSCSKSAKTHLSNINEFLSSDKLNECQQYITELSSEERAAINNDVCNLVALKFQEYAEKNNLDFKDLYNLKLYDKTFTDNCRKLWNIVKLFSVDKNTENYSQFVYIRYFAELNNLMQYRELYLVLSDINSLNYLGTLNNALKEYTENNNYALFENAYTVVSSFNSANFNPQQHLVADFISAHDNLKNSLKKAVTGFQSNDTEAVGEAMTVIYDALNKMLTATDTIRAVHNIQRSLYKTVSTEGNLYSTLEMKINPDKREYYIGIDFGLNTIYSQSTSSGLIDESDIPDTPKENVMSLNEAINISLNAINNTKKYQNELTVNVTEQRDINMTSFKTDTTINSALEITENRINMLINQTNGTRKGSVAFINGVSETDNLYTFIPPVIGNAQLNPNAVEQYTAVAGNAGYIITFTLKSDETNEQQPYSNVGSFVNGFAFDNQEGIEKYNTYYSPTVVMLMINNQGYLIKMQYTIIGVSNCEFASNDANEKAEAEFSFDDKFLYEFIY